jgi:hypothetical protein
VPLAPAAGDWLAVDAGGADAAVCDPCGPLLHAASSAAAATAAAVFLMLFMSPLLVLSVSGRETQPGSVHRGVIGMGDRASFVS